MLMHNILDFVYTGELKMTNENALDLFMIADRLELTTLFFSCVRYIEDHVDVNNCLGKYTLPSSRHHTKAVLVSAAWIFRRFL